MAWRKSETIKETLQVQWIKIDPYDATCRWKAGYATTTRCKQNDNIFKGLEHHGGWMD